jgi:hypothetical protein
MGGGSASLMDLDFLLRDSKLSSDGFKIQDLPP